VSLTLTYLNESRQQPRHEYQDAFSLTDMDDDLWPNFLPTIPSLLGQESCELRKTVCFADPGYGYCAMGSDGCTTSNAMYRWVRSTEILRGWYKPHDAGSMIGCLQTLENAVSCSSSWNANQLIGSATSAPRPASTIADGDEVLVQPGRH
jgi:hypothetical protein